MNYKKQCLDILYREIPELMEWRLGTKLVKDHTGYTVVNERGYQGRYGILKDYSDNYFEVEPDVKGFITLGNPVAPHHWLQLLAERANKPLVEIDISRTKQELYWGSYLTFNLKDGQPNTEEDYKALYNLIK